MSLETPLNRPPPPSDELSRYQRQLQRIRISQSVSTTYSLVLSVACQLLLIIIIVVSKTVPFEIRVWLGSIVGVMVLALQVLLCLYLKDPVYSGHFTVILMFITGIGFALSSIHLYYN